MRSNPVGTPHHVVAIEHEASAVREERLDAAFAGSLRPDAGYEVVEAAHGEAALDQTRRAPPRLVLTDWMMPRMGGGELIERLRAGESTKAIPIVIISGTRGVQGGADAVLEKPFEPSELIVLVDRLTGKER